MSDKKRQQKRLGFVKIEHWIIDELASDHRSMALHIFLNSNFHFKKTPFEYVVNNRSYRVLAGELGTSLERMCKHLRMTRRTVLKCLNVLSGIDLVQYRFLAHTHPSGKQTIDGMIITSRLAFDLPREETIPYHPKNRQPTSSATEFSYNYFLDRSVFSSNEENTQRARPHAHTRINNNSDSVSDYDSEGTKNLFDIDESPKKAPPEPLDDPTEYRFGLDQRFDPRVRETPWRQLAVDWYFWASENGTKRVFDWSVYPKGVLKIIQSGRTDITELREVFEKVVKTHPFWQRNFKRPDRFDDMFASGETRLEAAIFELKRIKSKNKSISDKKPGHNLTRRFKLSPERMEYLRSIGGTYDSYDD